MKSIKVNKRTNDRLYKSLLFYRFLTQNLNPYKWPDYLPIIFATWWCKPLICYSYYRLLDLVEFPDLQHEVAKI